jgi:hypothetical protein
MRMRFIGRTCSLASLCGQEVDLEIRCNANGAPAPKVDPRVRLRRPGGKHWAALMKPDLTL